MTFTVFYTRYFEEYSWYDPDTKEFDNLKDAWAFYNEMKNENPEDRNLALYAKNKGEVGYGSRVA